MLALRPTGSDDLAAVLALEKRYPRHLGQWPEEHHEQARNDPNTAHFCIVKGNHFAGYAILRGLDNPNRSLELMRLAVDRPGQGDGAAALRLLCRYAFEERQAHRLWLDVREHNDRARRAYRRAGFVEEGLLREAVAQEDGYCSLVVLSMLRREYDGR